MEWRLDHALDHAQQAGGGGTSRMDAENGDFTAVWAKVTHRFTNGTQQQRAWLGLTRPVGLVEDTALLAAPNEYAREYLDVSLRPAISTALSEELGRDIQVALTVAPREDVAGLGLLDDFGDENDDDVDPGEDPHVDAPPDHPGWAPVNSSFTRQTEIAPAPSRGTRLKLAVHVRHVRHRVEQPFLARGRGGRGRGARPRLQPAVHLRRLRARQDAPAARHRQLLPTLYPDARPLCQQ
jgi:chromosomal replication initiator protein